MNKTRGWPIAPENRKDLGDSLRFWDLVDLSADDLAASLRHAQAAEASMRIGRIKSGMTESANPIRKKQRTRSPRSGRRSMVDENTQRAVRDMRFLDRKTYKEIKNRFGLPITTIYRICNSKLPYKGV